VLRTSRRQPTYGGVLPKGGATDWQNPEYELPAIEFINETFSEPKEVKMLVQAYSMLRE
jgi:hypothetical protein